MKTDSKFKRIAQTKDEREMVQFYWEGSLIEGRVGDTIAAALLTSGVTHTRETIQSGSPRAPFCMMGSCYECRVSVNGEHNVQSCMRLIEVGMDVHREKN
ncbi:(2Fe-2S)-binding protein [Vibrio fluvialis]|nr:(2Fe-2S)-binding protein [Vibrio fluvialis]MBY7898802.1 (2Fe-2S)-binding protein [Vibrio fluvialis]MBY7974789.1 (2Fe-2S)-binding protein [Vibrio fluvialis]MBY7996668.1 (2Fe-2S)-binding protein [Vibrio fluvialis]MBY8086297.1 (2Fe-2S)-binding protein [Vibrio fluvialis]